MNKRQFLTIAALTATALPSQANKSSSTAKLRGPTLLTLTGSIGKTNRGAYDPAFDQMLGKHKNTFERAYEFDLVALNALPAITIKPTLEYDGKAHTLRGPLLSDVLKAAGVSNSKQRILLQAIDGYAVQVSQEEIQKYRFIVATELDGKPIPLGGIGPLWAVYDADRIAELASKPLKERFALCPWGVYHIAVQPA